MNQPLRVKKGKQGVLYGIKVENQQRFVNRISSRGSESQSHTPRVSVKKQKTPVKLPVNEKSSQNIKKQLAKESRTSKSIRKSLHDKQSSEQTIYTPPTTLIQGCKSCQTYQKQYNQLSQTLRKYQEEQRQLKLTLNQLKQQYEKGLRKYKVKSKIQRDELKLLKWILSERKEFHIILEQLQQMKQTKYIQFDQQQEVMMGKENVNENTCATDRSIIEKRKSQEINVGELKKGNLTKRNQTKLVQTSQQLELFRLREVQMVNHINVLQQKVMELTVKNDFLQRLKIKQKRPPSSNTSSMSIQHMNILSQQNLGNQNQNNHGYSLNKDNDDRDDEIIFDELSFDRQLFNQRSMNNNNSIESFSSSLLLLNSLHKRQKRGEVESRYISPFKQQTNDKVYRDFHKRVVVNDGLPESRSRYYDSIKQRSRLLQQ